MSRLIFRASIAAIVGAAAGAVSLTLAYSLHPGVTLEMDRLLPREMASGFYPSERAGDYTFAWTSRRADLTLAGVSRRAAWLCSLRFRGGRSADLQQPAVAVAVDGLTAARATATNELQDLQVTAPVRGSARGLSLTIVATPTVVPGPGDPRELGIQVDRLVCQPAARGLVLPPHRATRDITIAAALFGAALGLAGLSLSAASGAAVLVAAFLSFPLSTGPAPYTQFGEILVRCGAWIALALLSTVALLRAWTGQRLTNTAAFAVVFSAAALYLKLAALMHPSKQLIDAVFHAHRFEWVLGGRYYFTQPMPAGVSFPYAIGLYLFAAPWSLVTRDHVTLLRVVVCASEVFAGALLYPAIARLWGDRLAAAVAVALFSVIPVPFWVIGNANLTNGFGESAALVTVVAAATWPLQARPLPQFAGLFLLASLAFLSHVSTFALLAVTLLAAAVFYRSMGGPSLRVPARTLVVVTATAALFAVITYYGHFTETYKTAWRARTSGSTTAIDTGPALHVDAQTNSPAAGRRTMTSLPPRLWRALDLTRSAIGWPVLVLAAVGVWRLSIEGGRDRLALVTAAWGTAYLLFVGFALMRVDAPFERYAAEFMARVVFATYPAAVVLAARGAAWAWRAGFAPRVGASLLLFSAGVEGVRCWSEWFV